MSTLSKTAKKNAKKREKKREESMKGKIATSKIPPVDPVVELKTQLAEAKASGDVKLSAKLRQDLWILQDVNSGIDPLLEDKKAVEESLERLSDYVPNVKLNDSTAEPQPESTLLPREKELKKLNKKLRDIENIKEKKQKGLPLEATQLEKLEREECILEEIEDLRSLLGS